LVQGSRNADAATVAGLDQAEIKIVVSENAVPEKIIAPGGTIANIGVHGQKVALHLECLWDRNISITMRLVDTVTIPMLFKTVASRKIDPKRLITHRFKLDRILDAYKTFGNAAKTKALKVIIEV
jgi:alcohol dehydrogenase